MDRIKWLGLALGVLFITTLACGGGQPTTAPTAVPTEAPTQAPTEAPTQAGGTVSLRIVNNSGVDIWYVYISPTSSSTWGDDWLGADTIPAGESYVVTGITPGDYDLRADDSSHNAIETQMGVSITEDTVWTVVGEGAPPPEGTVSLRIVNNSGVDIWYVYISPTSSSTWGDDWLGADTIPAGESYVVTGITPGDYDLRADDSSHNAIETQMGVSITEDTVWTVGGGGAPPSGGGTAQWAVGAQASSQWGSDADWSPMQATGAPNVTECGDDELAWASESSSGVDWIELTYQTPVVPTEISIYESYAPSSIVEVLVGSGGNFVTVWTGTPQEMAQCPYVLRIPVSGVNTPVDTVRIVIDQSVIGGWNEIDAVQLVGVPQ